MRIASFIIIILVVNKESFGSLWNRRFRPGSRGSLPRRRGRRVDPDRFLRRFGYMPSAAIDAANIESRRAAIRNFQRNYGLRVTGEVNEETMAEMSLPRCGVKDLPSNPRRPGQPVDFNAPGPRWRSKSLTYFFENYSPDMSRASVRNAIIKGFKYWSDVANIDFHETTAPNADVTLKFAEGEHGDGSAAAFDGPSGVLAHAYFPEDGRVHFDDAESYTENTAQGINLETVAAHEFGHTLGIDHSYVRGALMYPSYLGYDPNFQLHRDDIAAVRSLYGTRTVTQRSTSPTTSTTASSTTSTSSTATLPSATASKTTSVTVNAATPSTTTVSTTTPSEPEHCKISQFNAMITGPDFTYAFAGTDVYRLSPTGVVDKRSISYQFPGGPEQVHAAVYSPATGRYYLFHGTIIYTFTIGFRRLRARTKPLTLPPNPHSALVWLDGRIIVFKSNMFYITDIHARVAFGPYYTAQYFLGVPSTTDSATVWRDGYMYYFQGEQYFKMNPYTQGMLSGYPKTTKAAWLGCGEPRARLSETNEPSVADNSVVRDLGITAGLSGGSRRRGENRRNNRRNRNRESRRNSRDRNNRDN